VQRHLLTQPLDGSAPAESLYQTHQDVWPGAWSPDGQSLVFVETPPTEFAEIKILSMGARSAVEPLVGSSTQAFYPSLSPDGRWLAYMLLWVR